MRASPSAVTSDAPGGEVKCRLLRRASMIRRSWSDFLETKKIPTSSRRSLQKALGVEGLHQADVESAVASQRRAP
eukprot:406355-Pyramimonas_sp.AAC.1